MCQKDAKIFHLRMLLYKSDGLIFTRKLGTIIKLKSCLDHSFHITVLIQFLNEFNVSQYFTDWGRQFHSLGAEHENAPLYSALTVPSAHVGLRFC